MKNLTTEEKLQIIRKFYAQDTEAPQIINDWEDKLVRLKVKDEWLRHPDTIALKDLVVEKVSAINSELANNEDLKDRSGYFREKKSLFALLAVLTEDPKSEINTIKNEIDEKLPQ